MCKFARKPNKSECGERSMVNDHVSWTVNVDPSRKLGKCEHIKFSFERPLLEKREHAPERLDVTPPTAMAAYAWAEAQT